MNSSVLVFENETWSIKVIDMYGNTINDLSGPQPTIEAAVIETAVKFGAIKLLVSIPGVGV